MKNIRNLLRMITFVVVLPKTFIIKGDYDGFHECK